MTAALEGSEWSAARPGRTLPPGKTRCPFYRRLGGPQGRSGRAENLVHTGNFVKCLFTFNLTHRNLTTLLCRVLVVRFPYHVIWHSHLHGLIPAMWGGGFPPTPCPILTRVCSFLGFSPRERALSRVSNDSVLPAASGLPPGMTSI